MPFHDHKHLLFYKNDLKHYLKVRKCLKMTKMQSVHMQTTAKYPKLSKKGSGNKFLRHFPTKSCSTLLSLFFK